MGFHYYQNISVRHSRNSDVQWDQTNIRMEIGLLSFCINIRVDVNQSYH